MTSGDGEHRGGPRPATGSARERREARLRAALRANLGRRKAQASGATPAASPDPTPSAPGDD